MNTAHRWGWALAVVGAVGCGGEPPPSTVETAAASAGEEVEREDESVQVEGLRGTLSPSEVQSALEPRMLKFAVCPGKSSDLEFIWGEMGFHFTVAADGTVSDVYATRSTFGDRATEKCMLKVARGTRFRRPRGGGDAEAIWSLEIPPSDDVREPVVWTADDAAQVIAASGAATLEECGTGAYDVTAYVDTQGAVMAVGVTNGRADSEAALDCVSASVGQWQFGSPGSYPAKLSFVLQ